jgi:DNA-binding response OmpR family regulator
MRHPGQVLSREQILNAVWGFDFDPGTKVLAVSELGASVRCWLQGR